MNNEVTCSATGDSFNENQGICRAIHLDVRMVEQLNSTCAQHRIELCSPQHLPLWEAQLEI